MVLSFLVLSQVATEDLLHLRQMARSSTAGENGRGLRARPGHCHQPNTRVPPRVAANKNSESVSRPEKDLQ